MFAHNGNSYICDMLIINEEDKLIVGVKLPNFFLQLLHHPFQFHNLDYITDDGDLSDEDDTGCEVNVKIKDLINLYRGCCLL